MTGRRKRRRHVVARWWDRLATAVRWCGTQIAAATCAAGGRAQATWRAARRRLRPWAPEVLVDARRARARRLRRMLRRTARAHFKALGVTPPEHLLIVAQRTVVDGDRPVASMLQVYEDADHVRRHVLFLALAVGDAPVTDGAVVAALRPQLHAVVGDELGELVLEHCCEQAQTPRSSQVVPMRRRERQASAPQQHAPAPPPFDEAPFPDDADAPMPPMNDGAYAVAAER